MKKYYKKRDLLHSVCLKLHTRKKDVEMVLNALIEEIKEAVGKGETVSFSGFGSFFPRLYKARKVYSFLAGQSVKIKERIRIIFKASKKWERDLNE